MEVPAAGDDRSRQRALHTKIFTLCPGDVVDCVPHGSGLEPLLFTIFAGDMASGISCTLSKFVDNTKLYGAVDTLEGRDVIKRDLGRLERWDCANHVKFNKAKRQGPAPGLEKSQVQVQTGQRVDREQL